MTTMTTDLIALQPTSDEITTIIDRWADERTSRSDEHDECTVETGLNSVSLIDMFGAIA